MLVGSIPFTGRPRALVTVTEKSARRRGLVHWLDASPIGRRNSEVFEDTIPIRDFGITLIFRLLPTRVNRVPAGE